MEPPERMVRRVKLRGHVAVRDWRGRVKRVKKRMSMFIDDDDVMGENEHEHEHESGVLCM